MRTTGFRSVVLYILLGLFVLGTGYLFFNIYQNGETWILKAYNGYIYGSDSTVTTGTITDSNGVILLDYEDGNKVYSDNTSIRTALLHTVGDSSGYIGTSVQSSMGADLLGYNIITGLNTLPYDNFGTSGIELTLDAELCSQAYELLGDKNGAVIIYNYETGEVICKVSTPTYDPMNIPSDLLTSEEYEGVFLDNTISSSYTPGSIMKVITTACAIENMDDWDEVTYTCTGSCTIDGGTVTCLGNHGTITIDEALGESCNVFFARLAVDLGDEAMTETAEELGFNINYVFDDFSVAQSKIDVIGASDLELAWAGIGQYTDLANPTQMMCLMGAIANGGSFVEPRINASTTSSTYNLMSSELAGELETLLRNNVKNYYTSSYFTGLSVCAKTGTAEVSGQADTSWMIGFCQDEDKPYAFAVVVEEGGYGITTAGKIASTLLTSID